MLPVKTTAVPLSIDCRISNLYNYECASMANCKAATIYLGMFSTEFRFVSKVAETCITCTQLLVLTKELLFNFSKESSHFIFVLGSELFYCSRIMGFLVA